MTSILRKPSQRVKPAQPVRPPQGRTPCDDAFCSRHDPHKTQENHRNGVISVLGPRTVHARPAPPNAGTKHLAHGRDEFGRVKARSEARHGAEPEIRMRVEHRCQLGPGALPLAFPPAFPFSRLSLGQLVTEVGADAPGLEPGRVHGHHRYGVDQVGTAGASDHGSLYANESPRLPRLPGCGARRRPASSSAVPWSARRRVGIHSTR